MDGVKQEENLTIFQGKGILFRLVGGKNRQYIRFLDPN
jgi:hypothetical protein